jgi:hypothetical protein
LNISRRQTALFQRTILAGNRMAEALISLDKQSSLPKSAAKSAKRWGDLMVELVEVLL